MPCNTIIGRNVFVSVHSTKRYSTLVTGMSVLWTCSLLITSLFLCSILSTLSNGNHMLLKGFICILNRISVNAHVNGMNPFNLGLCVSNSLFKTESTTLSSGKQEADVMSSIVEFLIQNCSSLFGSDVLTCISDKRIVVQSTSQFGGRSMQSIAIVR
jgi:hypothetical protein